MKVGIIGGGYVGLATAIALSQEHEVVIHDIDKDVVSGINEATPINGGRVIKEYMENTPLHIEANTDIRYAISGSDFVIIAVNTDHRSMSETIDTEQVEKCIEIIDQSLWDTTIVIKSTVPIGFTDSMNEKYPNVNIIANPSFLREKHSLIDTLIPDRFIVGQSDKTEAYMDLYRNIIDLDEALWMTMSNKEAEAVKLFSNASLALRLAFFNEVDSYAINTGLTPHKIIEGISRDHRIGNHYNHPSYGPGGYGLPKDTDQLITQLNELDLPLIKSLNDSNIARIHHIIEDIIKKDINTVGIYVPTLGLHSRESPLIRLINILMIHGIEVLEYSEHGIPKYSSLTTRDKGKFCDKSDLIISDKMYGFLMGHSEKIYRSELWQ